MTQYTLFFCALTLSALAAVGVVDGYSMPLASDPTNVRNHWDLPCLFGSVTIPGAILTDASFRHGYYDDDEEDTEPIFYSPLQPVDAYSPYSEDASEEHGYSGYEPFWNPRSRSRFGSSLQLNSYSPSPLSTGRVFRSNNNMDKITNSFRKASDRRRGSTSFTRSTPALSMANYMQNGGPGNGSSSNNYDNSNNNNDNNNRDYNSNNDNRDNYDYDDRNSRGSREPYDNNERYVPPPREGPGQPRGTNRFNTVGGVGSVNGSNVSREGRSMQFQNRRDSNTAGRSGRMMDDSFGQYSPDSNSRFESRSPNDNYAKGGYSQDSRTGHWTDPNSNYNINESPRPAYSSSNRYASTPASSPSFTPVPPGDYISAPDVRVPDVRVPQERGRVGAGGNVPYDNAYYNNNSNNNNENRDYYDYNHDPNNSDSDFYSRNGNIMGNRRGSRGGQGSTAGAPGMDQNYYNIGHMDSNRRMDRGGGIMRYRPNNQRADGGYYGSGNGNDYEVGGYDDRYDSSGSLYNSEGKRVRRFDPNSDRPEGYYNPDNLSNDSTDPNRMIQNKRRRDGRDVQNGAHLRRYDPDWDGRQGLYDEDSLYGSDVKGTRGYASGYGDSMDNRVVARGRGRRNTDDRSVQGGGRGERGGRDRYPMSSTSRRGDYQEDDYMEDGYDRQGERYGRSDSGRDQYDYEGDDRGARGAGGAKRGLGRRDMDGEREYYRSGDYRGPDLRGDDSMERFRQGKDVKKKDLYGFETANTPSSKKRIQRPRGGRESGNKRPRSGENMRGGGTANGGYNAPSRGGGRRDGSAGRDRGMSLDDLNEML
jgi:hypothetical protein